MATLDHAHSLLRLARRDYDALVGMQASALFADAIFGYHAQQAVEKALKAWLTVRGRSYPFTHDLAGLLMRLQDAAADVERFWPLERFSVYGILARYEEGDPDGTRVACDLVLMKEWKTRLPRKFQTRGLPTPPAGASRGSPLRAGA